MKTKKLIIDEKKNIDKIWKLVKELKKTIEKEKDTPAHSLHEWAEESGFQPQENQ